MVCKVREPHPDLTIKALMEEKTEVFKRVASEPKDRWKDSVADFIETLRREGEGEGRRNREMQN